MGAGHDHGARDAGAQHRGRLWAAFGLLAVFMVVEAVTAFATGSLALLSDAGHMFTDVLGIGMALAAITAARRAARDPQRTFGLYRLEVLAALANAVLLFGVALYVLVAAVRRFGDAPEVKHHADADRRRRWAWSPTSSRSCCCAGGAKESINVRGAYLEVLGDLVGSVGVLVGARRDRRHRLVRGRPAGRGRGRPVHPAPHLEARPRGAADPGAGRARAPRRRRDAHLARPRCRACATCTTCTSGR